MAFEGNGITVKEAALAAILATNGEVHVDTQQVYGWIKQGMPVVRVGNRAQGISTLVDPTVVTEWAQRPRGGKRMTVESAKKKYTELLASINRREELAAGLPGLREKLAVRANFLREQGIPEDEWTL